MNSEMQDLLIAAFNSQMNNVHTSLPCVVVQIQGPDRVAIQPAINQKFKDGGTKERPVVVNVPVSFPVSKTGGMTFPVKPGDTGMAIFSMRSIEAWKNSDGYPSTPLNYAKMDKQDAMFIPGLQTSSTSSNNPAKHSWSHSIEDTVMFAGLGTVNEVEVRLQPSGNVLIRTNQDVSVECDNASVVANTSASITTPDLSINAQNTTWIGDCTWSGNVTHTGVFSFNGVIFSTHRHAPGTVPPSNP
jgi:phage baseplate assembly protein gpV